jgi:hypothetical protein
MHARRTVKELARLREEREPAEMGESWPVVNGVGT